MDRLRLRQLVLEFAALAVDSVLIERYEDDYPKKVTIPELLKLWVQAPDTMLSPMFIGYCMGEGEDINTFSPESLQLAISTALVGESKDVEFDWMGDCDATDKPH